MISGMVNSSGERPRGTDEARFQGLDPVDGCVWIITGSTGFVPDQVILDGLRFGHLMGVN
jgi:hypothetical protein